MSFDLTRCYFISKEKRGFLCEFSKILLNKSLILGGVRPPRTPPVPPPLPLMNAACKGHLKIVKLLLQKGADVNSKDGYGSSPLYLAAKGGHLEVVKFLVQITLISKSMP